MTTQKACVSARKFQDTNSRLSSSSKEKRKHHLLLEKLEGNLSHNTLQNPIRGLVQLHDLIPGLRQCGQLSWQLVLKNATEEAYPGCDMVRLSEVGHNVDLKN